ncbi:unnamed protein product [Symbiodinium sp. CCMP2592]|nr:unnamed protein product [Symbiodinium sp. CCMP2592]
MLKMDKQFLLHFETGPQGMVHLFWESAQVWKKAKEAQPPTVDKSLRVTLILCMMMELEGRLTKMLAHEPTKDNMIKHGWLTTLLGQPAWPYMIWTGEKLELDSTKAAIPHSEMTEIIKEIKQALFDKSEELVHKFHSVRPLAEQMEGDTLPFLLSISTRGALADRTFELFRKLEGNTVLRVVGEFVTKTQRQVLGVRCYGTGRKACSLELPCDTRRLTPGDLQDAAQSKSQVNLTNASVETISPHGVDTIVAGICRRITSRPEQAEPEELVACTVDLRKAYKQLPVSLESLNDWVVLLQLHWSCYFDDFFLVAAQSEAEHVHLIQRGFFDLLGWSTSSEKVFGRRARQVFSVLSKACSCKKNVKITGELLHALLFFRDHIVNGEPRRVSACKREKLTLFTDASFGSEGSGLGGILYDSAAKPLKWFAEWIDPCDLVPFGSDAKEGLIYELEIFAAVQGVVDLLKGKSNIDLVLFVDNESALSCLISGRAEGIAACILQKLVCFEEENDINIWCEWGRKIRRKFRLVLCGNFAQPEGDPSELYAGGASAYTVRLALTFGARRFWSGGTSDETGAFLLVEWPENLARYAIFPPKILVEAGLASALDGWEVIRPLYGLRESPSIWAKWRTSKLQKARSGLDLNLNGPMMKMARGTLEFLRSYGMEEALETKLPYPKEWLNEIEEEGMENFSVEELKAAQRIVGEHLWLTMRCRPDLQYPVMDMASRVSKQPNKVMQVGRRLLSYLKATQSMKLVFGS